MTFLLKKRLNLVLKSIEVNNQAKSKEISDQEDNDIKINQSKEMKL